MTLKNNAIQNPSEHSTDIVAIADYHWVKNNLSVLVYNDLEDVVEILATLIPQDYIYLQVPYLQALWSAPPIGYDLALVLFRKSNQIVGAGVLMGLTVDSDKVIRYNSLKWLKSIYNPVVVSFGNLIITTNKQFYFDESIDISTQNELISLITQNFTQLRIENKDKPSFVLLKEFEEYSPLLPSMRDQKLLEFQVDPVFQFSIPVEWSTIDDYMAALKSKYRVTMKRNLRKGKSLSRKKLSLDEISQFAPDLNRFYEKIAEKALFNSFVLDPNYFERLKYFMQENMEVVGFFLKDKLVAFYSYILGPTALDAHFIGMDNLNEDYALYANLLYGLLSDAIENRKSLLNLSRTAPEAKSALGAQSVNYSLFTKNTNPLINQTIPVIFSRLYKQEKWVTRHPFKNTNHPKPAT